MTPQGDPGPGAPAARALRDRLNALLVHDKDAFGTRLRDLAKESGVGRSTISGWCRGPSLPRDAQQLWAAVEPLERRRLPGDLPAPVAGRTLAEARKDWAGLLDLARTAAPEPPPSPAGAAPAPVAEPSGEVFRVPRPRGAPFVGRCPELAELHERLSVPGTTVVTQVVHGLGGIGKSSLVAEYAHRHRGDHRVVWWINAESTASLDRGLAELARRLAPGALAADATTEQLAAYGMNWLARNGDWLLVLDNAGSAKDIAPLVGGLGGGRVVVTSRRTTGWRLVGPAVRLGVLAPDEAVALLRELTGRADDAVLGEVAAELGFLPLALDQAGAFIAVSGIGAAEYLGLLREQPVDALRQADAADDLQPGVMRTWRITLDHLAATDPLAVDLLRLLAWQAADPFPRSALRAAYGQAAADTALALLAAYSMVDLDAQTVTVHRLVQAVSRIPEEADPHRSPEALARAHARAVAAVREALPRDHLAEREAWERLLPHVGALFLHGPPEGGEDTVTWCELLAHAGHFLRARHEFGTALTYPGGSGRCGSGCTVPTASRRWSPAATSCWPGRGRPSRSTSCRISPRCSTSTVRWWTASPPGWATAIR